MQAIQIFFDNGERMFPDQARAMVARMLDGEQEELTATVMNYSLNGKNSGQGFPLVHFGGSRNGFRIIGYGDIGVTAARDIAPIIHRKMSKEKKGIIKLSQQTLGLSVESRPYAMAYTVPRMVVQKKMEHFDVLRDPVAGAAHLERLFINSIKRQAEAVGIALPNNLKATFKGADGTFMAKVYSNSKSKIGRFGMRNATFELNARLGGIWSVGYLMSKGYGNFNANLQLGTM